MAIGEGLAQYPLMDAIRGRRSKRFGRGMKIEAGPFAYASSQASVPLTEEETAALAFAACGITGYALADLSYGEGEGGSMLASLMGRTIASPDAIHMVALAVTNDEATYLLKRPQDFASWDVPELVEMGKSNALVELYRRSRIKLKDRRAAPPLDARHNFSINRRSLYAPGTTYFLPINDLTPLYVNVLLEAFEEAMGFFLLDERAGFRPAGLKRFARSRGGHLCDGPDEERIGTVQVVETAIMESAAIEQGMMLQNLGLMAQALGLYGFPNFARNETSWFRELDFTMGAMPASRYVGMNFWLRTAARALRKDRTVNYPLGLERDGELLLKPYCPPYYPSMEAAVRAHVEKKFGPGGVFRGGAEVSAWRDPAGAAAAIPGPSEKAIEATIAYCEYVYRRYGRFPAYSPPFRTVIGYQVCHGDTEFYGRFFRDGSEADRGDPVA